MKLCYYHNDEKNFGDDLNAWLFPKVLPGIIDEFCAHGDEYIEENNREEAIAYGIGTVLDHRIPPAPIKYILGSGVGYYNKPSVDERYRFYFVRGPKSAEALGLASNMGLNDPAILLKNLLQRPKPQHQYSLIMHCDTAKSGYWKSIAERCGFHYIDPRADDPLDVINALIASEQVITESLHGAIIADTFGIPWLPITSMPHINSFKWDDWCSAIQQKYNPISLQPIYCDAHAKAHKRAINQAKALWNAQLLKKAIKKQPFYLSDRHLINNQIDEMNRRLEQFKDDVSSSQP